MLPEPTRCRPQRASSSVLLPEPVLPIRTAYCPVATSKEMSWREKVPARTERLRTEIMVVLAGRRSGGRWATGRWGQDLEETVEAVVGHFRIDAVGCVPSF